MSRRSNGGLGGEAVDGVFAAGDADLARQFLRYRACWLGVGFVAVIRGGQRYRRAGLARAVWVLLAAEFGWLCYRLRGRSGFLAGGEAAIDAAVTTIGASACVLATEPGDQLGELANWSFSSALFSTAAGPVATPAVSRTLVQAAGSAALYGLVASARGRATRDAGIVNALTFLAWWAGGETFASLRRRSGAQIALADKETVASAGELAATRERHRMQDELHSGARRALEEIRTSWFVDRPRARAQAAQEALRIRRGLREEDPTDKFSGLLEELAVEAARAGRRIEVLSELPVPPSPESARSVLAGTSAVLARLPTSGDGRVIIRAAEEAERLVVTVRVRGVEIRDVFRLAVLEAAAQHCEATLSSPTGDGVRVVLRPLR
jgi:hypothetical protein